MYRSLSADLSLIHWKGWVLSCLSLLSAKESPAVFLFILQHLLRLANKNTCYRAQMTATSVQLWAPHMAPTAVARRFNPAGASCILKHLFFFKVLFHSMCQKAVATVFSCFNKDRLRCAAFRRIASLKTASIKQLQVEISIQPSFKINSYSLPQQHIWLLNVTEVYMTYRSMMTIRAFCQLNLIFRQWQGAKLLLITWSHKSNDCWQVSSGWLCMAGNYHLKMQRS